MHIAHTSYHDDIQIKGMLISMENSHSDVLILGAGVVGLSCALYLLKAGVGVRILDQGNPGCGSSHGNCGTITPSHAPPLTMPSTFGLALRSMLHADAPLYLNPRFDAARLRWFLGFARRCSWRDFHRAAMARWAILKRSREAMADLIRTEGIACEFVEDGLLYVYRTHKLRLADEKHHTRVLERLGCPLQALDDAEIDMLEPALKPGVVGGLLHPGDARLRPELYVAELARRVQHLGGIMVSNARVDRLDTNGSRLSAVHSTRGRFSADRVLMALGAWSPQLASQLGLRLPIQPGKGYSLTYTRPSLVPRQSLVLREASVCVTAWDSGFRVGSTMEFSGYAKGLNPTRLEMLRRGAAQGLRVPEGPTLLEQWWGWRPMSVDELPIIGPSTRWSNLHMATAHGMLGVSMSVATAELVTAQMTGSDPVIDPTPYVPSRFKL